MRSLAALFAALVVFLAPSASASAHRPANCGKLEPRYELRCAKGQLHYARYRLAHPGRHHSPAYWRWRQKVAHRWIANAHRRLELAAAHVSNYGAASYWTHVYFGHGWQFDLMMCVAKRESGYTLAALHQNYPTYLGVDHGPWQVNDVAHPWVDFHKIVRSWKYAAAVSWHLSGYGTDFSPWGGSC